MRPADGWNPDLLAVAITTAVTVAGIGAGIICDLWREHRARTGRNQP